MKKLFLICLFLYCRNSLTAQDSFYKTWDTATITLDRKFDEAVEISGIATDGTNFYLPSERQGKVLIGTMDTTQMKLDNIYKQPMNKQQFEGVSYFNGNFYLSDDSVYTIAEYSLKSTMPIKTYYIDSNGYEGFHQDKHKIDIGFEGIAVINDTTFFLLLEKDKSEQHSILYKGILRNDTIVIDTNKVLSLEDSSRYCDLYFDDKNRILYLLYTSFYGNGHNPCNNSNKYQIKAISIDSIWTNAQPNIVVDFSLYINSKCGEYSSNMEGLTIGNDKAFYVVSDSRENGKTLLIRLKRKTN